MFKFNEGARVRLVDSIDELGLDPDMTGIIWAMYSTVPNSYEVKFVDSQGKAIDVTLSEAELITEPMTYGFDESEARRENAELGKKIDPEKLRALAQRMKPIRAKLEENLEFEW